MKIVFIFVWIFIIAVTVKGVEEKEYDDLDFKMFYTTNNHQPIQPTTTTTTIEKENNAVTSFAFKSDYENYEEEMEERPQDGDWKWCLLTLAGNTTILQIRRNDFIKYLRINLASLVASSYDRVFFNEVSFTPTTLVNVSLDFKNRHSRIVSVLGNLARHNDTLFDLSGSHFNLTNFLPSYALIAPKSDVTPFASAADSSDLIDDPEDVEAIIYIVVGGAIAFLLTASLLFVVCQCLAPKRRTPDHTRSTRHSEYSLEDCQDTRSLSRNSVQQPKLIYSRGFSDSLVSPAETEVLGITPSVSAHSDRGLYEPEFRLEDPAENSALLGNSGYLPANTQRYPPMVRRSYSKPPSVIGGTDYQTVVIRDRDPRPSSALSSFKPLPPPTSFATPIQPNMMSPTSSTSSQSGQPPRKCSRPNIMRPSDEEIARDVRVIFHNMGLDNLEQ